MTTLSQQFEKAALDGLKAGAADLPDPYKSLVLDIIAAGENPSFATIAAAVSEAILVIETALNTPAPAAPAA